MTAAEIVAQVREYGGDVKLLPDNWRLAIEHRSRIPDNLAAEAKAHAEELRTMLRVHEVITVAEGIANARAIREGRFPLPEPRVCSFLIGKAGEPCRRCGASWIEHFA